MKIQTVKKVYFSPTGTTKAVIENIAKGIDLPAEVTDITRVEVRKAPLQTSREDLLLIGVPVYMGRVPALLGEWLQMIKARNTPAVCVVVYGNRVYDNALLELKDILVQQGCIPIAGAAFIGEHSFSNADTPIAQSRPDAEDLLLCESFGRRIFEKLKSGINGFTLNLPGQYPYGGVTELWKVDFIAVDNSCDECGICADVCPVEAIDQTNYRQTDIQKCISCCACIKHCPQNARKIKDSPVKEAAKRLNQNCSRRKEPELFGLQ